MLLHLYAMSTLRVRIAIRRSWGKTTILASYSEVRFSPESLVFRLSIGSSSFPQSGLRRLFCATMIEAAGAAFSRQACPSFLDVGQALRNHAPFAGLANEGKEIEVVESQHTDMQFSRRYI